MGTGLMNAWLGHSKPPRSEAGAEDVTYKLSCFAPSPAACCTYPFSALKWEGRAELWSQMSFPSVRIPLTSRWFRGFTGRVWSSLISSLKGIKGEAIWGPSVTILCELHISCLICWVTLTKQQHGADSAGEWFILQANLQQNGIILKTINTGWL